LGAFLLDGILRRVPSSIIYIVDPKRRFIAYEPSKEGTHRSHFPHGFAARLHEDRRGVGVFATTIEPWTKLGGRGRLFLVQDEAKTEELFTYLYRHADAREAVFLYLDESFDVMQGIRANRDLRRLIQQGGELNVGTIIINQRPRFIDATFITESEYLYIGHLRRLDDRKFLAENVLDERTAGLVQQVQPLYTWVYINQIEPEKSFRFKLKVPTPEPERHGTEDGNEE
jgi:hypothetical protein